MPKNNLSIFFGIFLVSMLFVPPSMSTTAAQDSEIPAWIKNNAGWWATDKIDDLSFLQGIQFLIKEGIMVIPPTETSESSGSEGIPTWIKNNAGWWADGQIFDDAFVSGIQWLVSNGIIVIEQEESVSSGPTFEIAYQTKVVSVKEPYSITLIYSTQNDVCSADDKEKAKAYGIMTEYLANKNSRPNPTQVTAYCKVLHEITGSTFPLVMKEFGINLTNMIVYVGGLKANFESYYDESAVAWWSCNWMYGGPGPSGGWQCKPNQIVVCDECRLIGTFSDTAVRDRDPGDVMERGMWSLSHEFGHHDIFEKSQQRDGWVVAVHQNQYAYDLCYENDILESEPCKKLYEKVEVMGKTYQVMDFNYIQRNWNDGTIESLRDEVVSITGIDSDFEGFKKYKLIEYDDTQIDPVTKKVDVTDILTIEWPEDWKQDYYTYDWSIWRTNSTDPDNISECCLLFQADSGTLRVEAELWKDDTRETGPQYYTRWLASIQIWFLDNIHYGGTTDEERFDALEDTAEKECSNASYGKSQYVCNNFKVLEKTIYTTDEGRTAYSLLKNYDLTWANLGTWNYHSTITEVYVGEDAWQIWTDFDVDVYEYSRHVVDRFNSSLVLLDATEPIPSVPATPATIVTEDGIQYKANRAWDEFSNIVLDEESVSYLANMTKITKYDVVCGEDCNISLDENMDVGEVMTKIWNGTDKEYDDWWYGEYGASSDNPHAGKTWDNEKQEWVDVTVDKWIYESTSLERFQNEKFVKQIWDVYTSITPKQIIEEIDTFLLETSDAGGEYAHVARCIDEDEYGCGPPDVSDTKWVISFDPLDMAPTSGQIEALWQPGKLKDALEINALKSTLIHENAHIITLSASQSDNDLLGYEELCDDDWKECDDDEIRRTFTQKAAACAPNFYDEWSGCLKDDSYLNKFFQKFWVDVYPEYYYGGNQIISINEFHKKYYDQFVTQYAAKHPAEDIAESFRAFVLWDEETIAYHKKVCKMEGWNLITPWWKWCDKIYRDNSIWEEKIRFFYDFPELVEMRDFIRSNL